MRAGALLASLTLAALPARADEAELSLAQQAQLEALRAEVAGQLQLQAFDLLDELVYGWSKTPVFANPTPVVLADVSVPVGFGSGLKALVETHFADLVSKNPRGNLLLVHCSRCTELIVHSGAKGTVISRGVDQPEALRELGALSQSQHALHLDFEAEGASLVLRARVTELSPSLPILYARTLSSSTSTAALLRSPEHLQSASEAREEYLEALRGRGLFLVPLRVGVRTYAPSSSSSSVGARAFPFLWLQLGLETALTRARAYSGSVSLGASYVPGLQTGYLMQARVGRLLSGSTISLTRPDVYGFVGASAIWVHGPGALVFATRVPTAKELLDAATGVVKPQELFGAFQLGVELRLKNRVGAGLFLESAPSLNEARSIGNYADLGFVQFHSFGAEVTFCF